jgi:hypothetical protein
LKLPPSGATTAEADALCKQSEQAAKGLNIEGAVSLYRSCAAKGGSPTAQAAARIRIRNAAPEAVKRRGFNGDCAGARSAASAASSIGGAPVRRQLWRRPAADQSSQDRSTRNDANAMDAIAAISRVQCVGQ